MKLPAASTLTSAPETSSEELTSSATEVLEFLEEDLARRILDAREKGVVAYRIKVDTEKITQPQLSKVASILSGRLKEKGYAQFISPLCYSPGNVWIVVMWKVRDLIKKCEEYARLAANKYHDDHLMWSILHQEMINHLYEEMYTYISATNKLSFKSNDGFSSTLSRTFPPFAAKKKLYTYCDVGGSSLMIHTHDVSQ